jgi:glycerol-3-phosphate dehydrogenase (NAD(P)+)
MDQVCVLGAGSFGTALAQLCARQGQRVVMWMRSAERAKAINRTHKNPDALSDFELSWKISATSELPKALDGAEWVIVAVPSHSVREVLGAAAPHLRASAIVMAAKGIENESLMTMVDVAVDVLGPEWRERVLALSGPSFAREIMQEHPTAVVLACKDEGLADSVGRLLFCDNFRAYSSTDVVGVEMGGALKNVIAVAAGAVSGMGLGDNTRAALITRGVAEIARLAVARGAHPLTLAGLAGVGDLVLTCTGALSRNRAIGQLLGEGKSLAEAQREVNGVAEGVKTAVAAKRLADELGVDVPIVQAIYRVLYQSQPVRDALLDLVRREPGRELEH